MDMSGIIKIISSSRGYEGQIVHVENILPRDAEFGSVELKPLIQYALAEKGIKELYTHQADAVKEVLDGKDVVLSTSTASGKSLC
ncbi:MAG: ATP-dependent helicase, partial [Methanococcoides sp.]|nr:ATP-dependent helicase [Methanococcoides sp.]